MLSRLLVACFCCLIGSFALPHTGLAWTYAHVREAHVALDLADRERIAVTLDLRVEVRGGWLERLELPGLDEDLALAEHEPALALLETGERVPAQVSARASTLVLKFNRRDGLRRGQHHVIVRYTTARAAHSEPGQRGVARLRWSLPGFEAGLTAASIEVRGQPGLHAVAAPELAQRVESQSQGALRFSRLHVPRSSPWNVAIDLPAAPEAALGAARKGLASEGQAAAPSLYGTGALWLASLVSIWLLRRHVFTALGRQGLVARGLLFSRPLSALALLALSLAGAVSQAYLPAFAALCWLLLFAFGVPQARAARGPIGLGSFRPVSAAELKTARRQHVIERLGVPWADLTTALGALGAFASLLAVAWLHAAGLPGSETWGVLSMCALLGWTASARSFRPRSLSDQLAILTRAAERTRAVGCALRLVAYESGARLMQPRLRLLPSARYPGLLQLEVMVDSRRAATSLLLSARVEVGSPAERWLTALWPDALREGGERGQRIALLQPVEDVGQALELVLEHMSHESQRLLFAAPDKAQAA